MRNCAEIESFQYVATKGNLNFCRKNRSHFKGSVMPTAATVLKSHCKRQNKAAEKIIILKVTMGCNLAATL